MILTYILYSHAQYVRGDDGQIHPSIMCCKCYKESPRSHKFITDKFDPADRPTLHELLAKEAAQPPPYGRSKLTPCPPNASPRVQDHHETLRFVQHALGAWAYDRLAAKQASSTRLHPDDVHVIDPSLEELASGCSAASDMVLLLRQQAKHLLEGAPMRDAQLGLMRSCVDTIMDLIIGTLVRCPSSPVPLSKALMRQIADQIKEVRTALEDALSRAHAARGKEEGGELERIVSQFQSWSRDVLASSEQMMHHASSE